MQTQSKILKWSLILGIIIVLNLFFNYALSLVYKSPEYNTYCPQTQVVKDFYTEKSCVDDGGQWNRNTPQVVGPKGETIATGYCDVQFTCRQTFEEANKNFNRNVFTVLVILGALSVLIGNFLKGNEVLSSGLSLGGVLSFIVASMRYWQDANDWVRVVILAIALGILIWVAMKKFKNQS